MHRVDFSHTFTLLIKTISTSIMRNLLKTIIEAALSAQLIKFSQQEILADGSTRVIGYVNLNCAPQVGSFLLIEKTNSKGEKYFKSYQVQKTTLLLLENGNKEGFLYLKFTGIQSV